MPSATLVIFGAGLDDISLASNFFAFIKLYLRIAECEVTAVSSIDLGPMVESGPLIHGYQRLSGRQSVWTKHERDHRLHPYRVAPVHEVKNTIFQWIAAHNILTSEVLTMIFVGHGARGSGEFCIGSQANGTLLCPGELIGHLNGILAGLRINLTFLSCYSGRWVDEIRMNCQHQKTFVHAACDSDEEAGPFRSVSGVFRCGLFGAAIVSTIPRFGLMCDFLEGVEDYMDIVITDPDTSAVPHLPTSMMSPPTETALSVEEVLLSTRTVARTAQLPRAILQISGRPPGNPPSLPFASPSVSHPQSNPNYVTAATAINSITDNPTFSSSAVAKEEFTKIMANATKLSFKEVRLEGIGRKFLNGQLSSSEIIAYQNRLNLRREQQNTVGILFAALAREMLVNRDEIVGRHFSMHACWSSPAVLFNATLIDDCFPILQQFGETDFAFQWPAIYLAYAIGFAVSRGNSISTAMLLRVGAGVGVVAAPVVGGERLFEPVALPPAATGGGVLLNIFDRVLPLTREEMSARLLGTRWVSVPHISLE